MAKVQIGTVSHATLRNEDLLEAFASELDALSSEEGAVDDDRKLIEEAREVDPDSEEASEIVNELMDRLNNYAPPFCYFGSTEGDGADFGFWVDMDSLEEDRHFSRRHNAPVIDDKEFLEESELWVHVNDHGNITLYQDDNGKPGDEIWSSA